MLLAWRGRRDGRPELVEAARRIETALDAVLSRPEFRPRDLGGQTTTTAFADHVAEDLAAAT
jgi:3-isopropylmalate dehydrogenase